MQLGHKDPEGLQGRIDLLTQALALTIAYSPESALICKRIQDAEISGVVTQPNLDGWHDQRQVLLDEIASVG